jgi:hypothetical protein
MSDAAPMHPRTQKNASSKAPLFLKMIAPHQVDIATGQQQLVKELIPADPAGLLRIGPIQLTPDAKTYVYSYARYLSELYIIDGLK